MAAVHKQMNIYWFLSLGLSERHVHVVEEPQHHHWSLYEIERERESGWRCGWRQFKLPCVVKSLRSQKGSHNLLMVANEHFVSVTYVADSHKQRGNSPTAIVLVRLAGYTWMDITAFKVKYTRNCLVILPRREWQGRHRQTPGQTRPGYQHPRELHYH